MNVSQFQQWLNARGAALKVDGSAGPATRAAIVAVFTNTAAPAINAAQMQMAATRIGCTTNQLRAIAAVESSGGGFDDRGLVKILWERHYFWKRIRRIIPWISNPKGGDYALDASRNGVNDSWEKLCLAIAHGPIAAFESASWGKFQIMGSHAVSLGFGNALEFAYALSRSELAHYEALAEFIAVNKMGNLARALSRNPRDCAAFALRYNGRAALKNGYDRKLAAAMAAL